MWVTQQALWHGVHSGQAGQAARQQAYCEAPLQLFCCTQQQGLVQAQWYVGQQARGLLWLVPQQAVLKLSLQAQGP